jgi:hypothetical protein
MTVLNVILGLVLQASLCTMWSSINSLQVIMILVLMKVDLPANAYNVLEKVITIVAFDIISFLPLGDWIEFSYTDSVATQFELIGFAG